MWPGPYGDGGSRKYLLASLDQSLRRMGLAYVDIFYSHRPDPATPLEETMGPLPARCTKARLYTRGFRTTLPSARQSRGHPRRVGRAIAHPPALVLDVQPVAEGGLLDVLEAEAPAASLLPARSGLVVDQVPRRHPGRLAGERRPVPQARLDHRRELVQIRALDAIARRRGQSLAQMALAWVLRDQRSRRPDRRAQYRSAGGEPGQPRQTGLQSEELDEIDRYALG